MAPLSFLLLLCLLTRYVNFWLLLLLPVSFLLRGLLGRFFGDEAPPLPSGAPALWRQMGLALALGIIVFLTANLIDQVACRSARLTYHSRIGRTFLWRLSFLEKLPANEREDLLERVAERSGSAAVRKLLQLTSETVRAGQPLTAPAFFSAARTRLFQPGTKHEAEKFDLALNRMLRAFLFPPEREYLRVVRDDFTRARQISLGRVVDFYFATTAYYFDHRDAMPACATLRTFRGTDARTLSRILSRHPYLRFGGSLTYNACIVGWLVALPLLAFFKRRQSDGAVVIAYAVSLVSIGLLMMFSSCFFGELLPRYVLPMWEMLFASSCITLGATLDHAFASWAARRS